MAKISPKIDKIEIWAKSRPKVINSPNKSHRDYIWGKTTFIVQTFPKYGPYDLCHMTFVNGPFVALGKTVHFAPLDQFLDLWFPS